MTFEEFFRRATAETPGEPGMDPYGYQVRLARGGLPPVVQAPTGAGKTGIILAWLWRRLHGLDPEATPRRLVLALPQRTLVEQVAREVARWLARLDLGDQVALHVVMGGAGESQRQWRLDLHRPAIVVGTVDSLVSKALNRGYGISRATYPIDFALVTNGAHWVVDEIQLCPESTTTLRQLAAFTRVFGTAEPFGLTCMSATVDGDLLRTVDNPELSERDVLRIEPAERTGELATRLAAARTVRQLPGQPVAPAAVAAALRDRHRPGTLTLAVTNTVDTARQIYSALRGSEVPCTLLHSRFRAVEREQLINRVTATPGEAGHIVVATQVVEAGVDLNAAVMFTEAAPWPSVVQRAGRCNRTGRVAGAELWWLPPADPKPYEKDDVDAAVTALAALEGEAVTGEQLLDRAVPVTPPEVAVIRRVDLLTLFDTAPDLNGADLDVSPYVRDTEDLDAQLAWATWEPAAEDGRPPDGAKAPEQRWRCRVPLAAVRELAKRTPVWRFDQAAGRWTAVTSTYPARPGEVLVVAAGAGGYDPELGLDPKQKRPVAGCPSLSDVPDPVTGTEDAYRQDDASVDQPGWLTLEQHSVDVRDQARALLATVRPWLPPGAAEAVERAGYAHDVGKAHPVWQEALCRLDSEYEQRLVDGPWAKSGINGGLQFAGGVTFRHELASLLLLDGPLAGLLAGMDTPDLVRYLVLAHHGKLRVQVRGPDDTEDNILLGLEHRAVTKVRSLLGQPAGELVVDLAPFTFGHDRSWTRTALALRDQYGPFVLAYLEALVRIADWRASAEMTEATL